MSNATCFALAIAVFAVVPATHPAKAAEPAAAKTPLVVSPAQSPAQAYDAGTLRVIVPSARTGGEYAVLELTEAGEYRTPPHQHPGMEETFYVLEGTLKLDIAGTTHELPPGSFVHIPRGTPHAQGSADGKPVRLLATFSPGGFDQFFLDRVALGREVGRGDPDFQPRMLELVGKYPDWLQPAGPAPGK